MTSETTKVVRQELERACNEFTVRIAPLGFLRTRKMFWTRSHPLTVDFVYLFRSGSSYGAPINYSVDILVHFGIRVLNAKFAAAHLNGPSSDPRLSREGRYHLRFNAQTGSTFGRCVDDLSRFVIEQGEPWFQRFRDNAQLLNSPESPLSTEDRALLQAALAGQSSPENEGTSRQLLGLK